MSEEQVVNAVMYQDGLRSLSEPLPAPGYEQRVAIPQQENPFTIKFRQVLEKESPLVQTNNPPVQVGIGGAPSRATTLPANAAERKKFPIASGFMDYFPDAIAAVARLSWQGNEQHNPGQPLHWARGKSADEWDTMMRHFLQRGTLDTDGIRHSVKIAWRALAALQKEIEAEQREKAA